MATSARIARRRVQNSELLLHLSKLGPLGWVGEALKYFLLILLAVTFMLPFIWMVSSALKDSSQVFTVPPTWIPSPALWENFPNAWTEMPFSLWLYNTVVKYAIPTTVGTVYDAYGVFVTTAYSAPDAALPCQVYDVVPVVRIAGGVTARFTSRL